MLVTNSYDAPTFYKPLTVFSCKLAIPVHCHLLHQL